MLTFDRDFGEPAFHRRRPSAPGGVLFRLGPISPDQMLSFLRIFFESQPKLRGFFTVALIVTLCRVCAYDIFQSDHHEGDLA